MCIMSYWQCESSVLLAVYSAIMDNDKPGADAGKATVNHDADWETAVLSTLRSD